MRLRKARALQVQLGSLWGSHGEPAGDTVARTRTHDASPRPQTGAPKNRSRCGIAAPSAAACGVFDEARSERRFGLVGLAACEARRLTQAGPRHVSAAVELAT